MKPAMVSRLRSTARRTRGGFTLVELLVVVAIVALLVALLAPQLSAAKVMARQMLCAQHLQQLGGAFLGAAAKLEVGAGGRVARKSYPNMRRWPMVPFDTLPQAGVYLCPEDPGGAFDCVPGLEYHLEAPSYGDIHIPFEPCLNCKTRRGTDASGPYIEFIFEESPGVEVQWCPNGPSEYPNCQHHDDKDGVFRFHSNGDGTVTITLVNFWDNQLTEILLYGQKFWPKNAGESLYDYVNKPERLAVPYSSYGINSEVSRHAVAPDTVVLLDYNAQSADMTFPDIISQQLRLKAVARHYRGRINVLFADNSVRSMGAAELDPTIYPDLWSP